jgi:hypothetical protein
MNRNKITNNSDAPLGLSNGTNGKEHQQFLVLQWNPNIVHAQVKAL